MPYNVSRRILHACSAMSLPPGACPVDCTTAVTVYGKATSGDTPSHTIKEMSVPSAWIAMAFAVADVAIAAWSTSRRWESNDDKSPFSVNLLVPAFDDAFM